MSQYTRYPTLASSSWQAPVANLAALPATNNSNGDVRVTLDTGNLYEWNGSAWTQKTGVLLSTGDLTDVGTDGIVITGGTGAVVGSGTSIAQHVADSTHNGYLSSTDWSTFNNKGSGSVTSVAMTVPSFLSIAGSPVTTSGTLALTLSGTALPILNGGTGQTTKSTAYNALTPITTTGDLVIGTGANTAGRLAIGASGTILTAGASTASWVAPINLAYYGSTSTVSNTVATFIYNTAEYDTNSAYNTGTGVFTVPATGKYLIQGQFLTAGTITANNIIEIGIAVNSVVTKNSRLRAGGTITDLQAQVVATLNLTSGDLVNFVGRCNGSTTVNNTQQLTFMSIVKIA